MKGSILSASENHDEKISRLYTLPVFTDEKTMNSIEMVFMDEHGSTIHATVRRSLVGTFQSRIKEGSVYVFAYFGIGISSGYYRTDCMKRVVNLIPRYRIKTRVIDTSDSATFVLFENVGCLILHKSCAEMMKYCEDVPGGDVQPDVFNALLIDKLFLFKVEVRRAHFNEFDPSYNVIDICFNE